MMLSELRLLLTACPPDASINEYRSAIVDDNVLMKRTDATRRASLQRLREFYSLDTSVVLFGSMRDLWNADASAQPLLAMLCISARDPLLRATAGTVLPLPVGSPLGVETLVETLSEYVPGRYNGTTLLATAQHIASSWQQSGHLKGKVNKVRVRADCRPAALAYALLLGHLCGARGERLFETLWAALLDAPIHLLHKQAVIASQHGWIDYRRSGNVTDVGFGYLLQRYGRTFAE